MLAFRHNNGEDIDEQTENDGQSDCDPCSNPAGSSDREMIYEILPSDVNKRTVRPLGISIDQSLKNVHVAPP